MSDLLSIVFGPLAAPECRRALGRGWVILVRGLAAVAALGVALVVVWWWWVVQQTDPEHSPFSELRFGLAAVVGLMTVAALILGPAVMAGSIAGEKERGSLALLMTTRVNSWEIVLGRIAGKFSQVGMIVLAAVPAVVLLGSYAGHEPLLMLLMVLLPLAVGFGGIGLAAMASTLSRRGRDALLAVYLADFLLLIAADLVQGAFPFAPPAWLVALNPLAAIEPLVWRERAGGAALSIAVWVGLGMAGALVSAWRLRPACLAVDGGREVVRRHVRRFFVPPVNEKRPMLWKELFIERVGSVGRFGALAGGLLVVGLLGFSVTMTLMIIGPAVGRGSVEWADWARFQLGDWVGGTGAPFVYLIQWSIGLRAAVAISSERERGTWIALMTSPLGASEIVVGKLWGSLYALRWLIGSAIFAWTLAAFTGAVPAEKALLWAVEVFVGGAFMAAVGVRTSVASESPAKAMAVVIGVWLAAQVAISVATTLLLVTSMLLCNVGWIFGAQLGLVAPLTTFWVPVRWAVAYPIASNVVFAWATLLVVADSRLRFDRLAGRMTEGKMAVAFDEFLYGRPVEPVLAEAVPVEGAAEA